MKLSDIRRAPHPSTGRFAALDFETADYQPDSACALSIVIGEAGQIVRSEHWLIRPPRRQFVFTYIHGITWQDVAGQPGFGEIWQKASALLQDVDFIAAHNARFDRAVLTACCAAVPAPLPEPPFLCTVKLARRAWNIRPTKLPDVCRKFNIPLNHHDAQSDAQACARIVLEAMTNGLDPWMGL